jgi:hypothetical protein
MQLAYGAPTGSSRQSSLLYCIGISSATFPAANNNATLQIFILCLTLKFSKILVIQHETETLQFHEHLFE